MNTDLNLNTRPIMFLSFGCGIIVALCISVGARIFGHSPGIIENPLADRIGTQVLEFKTAGLDGGIVSSDMMNGIPYILFFTASGCQGCDLTYPILETVSKSQKIFIVGIGNRNVLKQKIRQEHGIHTVVGFDSLKTVIKAMKIYSTPTAYLVAKNGVILDAASGNTTIENMLSKNIDGL